MGERWVGTRGHLKTRLKITAQNNFKYYEIVDYTSLICILEHSFLRLDEFSSAIFLTYPSQPVSATGATPVFSMDNFSELDWKSKILGSKRSLRTETPTWKRLVKIYSWQILGESPTKSGKVGLWDFQARHISTTMYHYGMITIPLGMDTGVLAQDRNLAIWSHCTLLLWDTGIEALRQ